MNGPSEFKNNLPGESILRDGIDSRTMFDSLLMSCDYFEAFNAMLSSRCSPSACGCQGHYNDVRHNILRKAVTIQTYAKFSNLIPRARPKVLPGFGSYAAGSKDDWPQP
jgi:hypothetical protein